MMLDARTAIFPARAAALRRATPGPIRAGAMAPTKDMTRLAVPRTSTSHTGTSRRAAALQRSGTAIKRGLTMPTVAWRAPESGAATQYFSMTATAAIRAQEFLTATAGEGCTTRKGATVAPSHGRIRLAHAAVRCGPGDCCAAGFRVA